MTANGEPKYLDDYTAAGQQAVKDVAKFQDDNNKLLQSAGPAAIAPILAAIGSLAGAGATAASAGSTLASLIAGGKGGSLEVQICNFSSYPLVLYQIKTENGNISKTPQPLAQGEDDVFLLTHTSSFSASSTFQLYFFLGSISIEVRYKYTDEGDPGRWQLHVGIDNDEVHEFPDDLALFGATFTSDQSGTPNFSLYSVPIETGSGQIDLTFYNLAK
jgi:hypothetical protein